MLRITKYGEAILKKQGEKITTFDKDLVDFANEMLDTMYDAYGIGLAAQQVDRALMMFVIDINPDEGEIDFDYLLDGKKPPIDLIMPMAVINPEITHVSHETEAYEEGCLSFPEIRGDVVRPKEIEVKFQDLDGQSHHLKCDGIFARCIQHETDHLNGVLFTDRMSPKELGAIRSDIKKLKKQTLKAQKS